MVKCSGLNNTYCCGSSTSCCDTDSQVVINPVDGAVLSASASPSGTVSLWAQPTTISAASTSSFSSSSTASSQESSASASEDTASPTGSASNTGSVSGSVSSTTPTSSEPPAAGSGDSSGLSAGAGAGIGIAAAVGALGVGSLIWLIRRYLSLVRLSTVRSNTDRSNSERRKRQAQSKEAQGWQGNQGFDPSSSQGYAYMNPNPPQPMYAPQELGSDTQYHEMESQKNTYSELPGQTASKP